MTHEERKKKNKEVVAQMNEWIQKIKEKLKRMDDEKILARHEFTTTSEGAPEGKAS